MTKRQLTVWIVGTTLIPILPAAIVAETIEVNQKFAFTNTPEIVASLEDGRQVWTVAQHGFVIAEDSSSPLHLANQNCFGTFVGTNQAFEGAGYCTSATASEGATWISWSGNQEGGTWTVLRGNGRFAGATGSGTYSLIGATSWADGKTINSAKGKIEIP